MRVYRAIGPWPFVAAVMAGFCGVLWAQESRPVVQGRYSAIYVQESASAPKAIPGVATALPGRAPPKASRVNNPAVTTFPRPASGAQACAASHDPGARCPAAR